MDAKTQERLIGGIGTAVIVGAIGAGLVLGLDVDMHALVERPLALVTLAVPPPPPPARPKPPVRQPRRSPAKDAPAPPNLKSKATPVASPPPIVRLPPPLPMIVAPKPGAGVQTSNGASDRPGPGEGAGGSGNGRGGGYGDGEGGGSPPRYLRGDMRRSDLPEPLRSAGWQGTIAVDFVVTADGHVHECRVSRSTGHPDLDRIACALMEQRYRYAPARDEAGRAVTATIVGERFSWLFDREEQD